MVLVKILGLIDFASAIAFLCLAFNIHLPLQFILFCGGLLLLKSLFILNGDLLSVLDLISGVCLFISIFTTLPTLLIWVPAFLLMAKSVVSFL